MTDTLRTLFIGLGIVVLLLVLVPFAFMGGMMTGMSGGMMSSRSWVLIGLVLVLVMLGGLILALSLRCHSPHHDDRASER